MQILTVGPHRIKIPFSTKYSWMDEESEVVSETAPVLLFVSYPDSQSSTSMKSVAVEWLAILVQSQDVVVGLW